jgi:hypothetical protein
MEETVTNNNILDFDLFQVCGLEVDEETRLDIEAGLYRAAVIELLENELPRVMGEEQYSKLEESLEEMDMSDSVKFVEAITLKGQELGIEVKQILDQVVSRVEEEFVQDQINYFERKAQKITDPTQKELKLSAIRDLKNLFSKKSWEQMGALFKSANLYTMQDSLVLSL